MASTQCTSCTVYVNTFNDPKKYTIYDCVYTYINVYIYNICICIECMKMIYESTLEVGDATRLRTRWTLGFAFKLLPWRPRALFSGVSEYTIDPQNAKALGKEVV